MAEPTIPAGVTVAFLVMSVISWYGMLRAGVQLIHDEIKKTKSVKRDFRNMFEDLEHQKNGLEEWRKTWYLSDNTPNTILVQYWGETRFDFINKNLKQIESYAKEAREELRKLGIIKEDDAPAKKNIKSSCQRYYYTKKFIWTKETYVQKLIDKFSDIMNNIKDESDAGWKEKSKILAR